MKKNAAVTRVVMAGRVWRGSACTSVSVPRDSLAGTVTEVSETSKLSKDNMLVNLSNKCASQVMKDTILIVIKDNMLVKVLKIIR